MKRISLVLLAATVAFASCKEEWKKGGEGMQYKIIADGKGDKVKPGEFLEVKVTTAWNNGKKDSILNAENSEMPTIVAFDSVQLGKAFFAVLKDIKKGDSVATKVATDSFFKGRLEQMPPFMKKGQFLMTNLRITNIYKTKEEAEKASEANMKIAEEKARAKSASLVGDDDKALNEYFKKNNIKAVKTANGNYVEILQPGTGANLDTSAIAKINYTGKLLNGTMFDSNTDPSKNHVQLLTVNLTSDPRLGPGMIAGMTEGLKMFNKGAKGRIFIPSGQGYGPQARSAELPANANLVFDVEVVDIINKAQAAAEMAEMQKKYMEMQKQQQAMQQAQQQAQPQPADPSQK